MSEDEFNPVTGVPRQGPKQVPGPNDMIEEEATPDNTVKHMIAEPVETDEEPPDPGFLIVRNAFGPGAHSVKLPDGTPVGVWVRAQGMTGDETRVLLSDAGLDADLVEFFARNRDGAIAADAEIVAHPPMRDFAAAEAHHTEKMEHFRAEFLKAQKKAKS